jgi:hypothetical protein
MKKLLALTHPDEWNQLLPFNSFIKSLKEQNGYEYVIAVVPYKGNIVISEADEIITVADGDLFSYPDILEKLDTRRNDDFLNRCVRFCFEKYGSDNIDIKSWQNTEYDDGVVDEINKPPLDYYRKSFEYAKKFFDGGLTIKPTKKIFKEVENKYGHIFNDKTLILLTRNFNNKANIHNTTNTLPYLEETLNYLTNNGIKIVNIGFPPKSFNINNENYTEINDNLTQNELVSLFYLSNGVMMAADAGGFVTHYGSNVDFYIMSEEWSVTNKQVSISLIEAKKTNKTVSLVGLNNEDVYQNIISNMRPQEKIFSDEKIINII